MNKHLKSLLKGGVYTPELDRISGCERGTILYWHEQRHRWQNKKGLITPSIWILFIFNYVAFIDVIIGLINGNIPYKVITWGIFLGIIPITLIEIDAWRYCIFKLIFKTFK